uniref:DNA-directed RNA polymerase II subunit RPB9-like zinc ribbon domain-containing protein n=1 Tax=Setaria viridis TaxID=4556 RepID=A0A4U6TM63_SETVI|nr:hypothetical protein SEVIR_8G237800v2 [Setaria viridis]
MRFCRECNNILYPKEDRRNRVLYCACRSCDDHQIPSSYALFLHRSYYPKDLKFISANNSGVATEQPN